MSVLPFFSFFTFEFSSPSWRRVSGPVLHFWSAQLSPLACRLPPSVYQIRGGRHARPFPPLCSDHPPGGAQGILLQVIIISNVFFSTRISGQKKGFFWEDVCLQIMSDSLCQYGLLSSIFLTWFRQFRNSRRNGPLRYILPHRDDQPPPYSQYSQDNGGNINAVGNNSNATNVDNSNGINRSGNREPQGQLYKK